MDAALKFLVKERASYKSALTRFRSYFETYDRTLSASVLKIRLNKIIPILEALDVIQKTIEKRVEDTEFDAAHIAVRDEFENSYCPRTYSLMTT